MHFFLIKGKKPRLLALLLLSVAMSVSSCKQSEFYEKQGLSEVAIPGSPNNGGTNNGGDSGTGSTPGSDIGDTGGGLNPGGSTGGGNTGGGDGGTTTPPVVVTPPEVTPPIVVIPPVIIEPPVVVNPPVITPPVVVNPPVITPPVVTPPIENVILSDRSETFTQEKSSEAAVDILWVIDDSGSMADEQDALGKNFQSFIDQFLQQNVDFKMAITTTDGTSTRNGRMVGDSGMLTRASAQGNRTAFTNNFMKWVKVGTAGSGIEQGLKTSTSFFDRYGASFLRSDAYLVVVYLSDEEDQSDKKVSEYLTKLQALKTNKGMVKAYSIVTVKDYGNEWETIGKRYIEVSNATAGTVGDIKKEFAPMLKDIGGRILNLLDSFALSEAPYQNAVEVYVNNLKVQSGWVFDSAQRTVKFNTGSVPTEGAKVEVRYKVKANVVLGAI
jgi:hypothetical protein